MDLNPALKYELPVDYAYDLCFNEGQRRLLVVALAAALASGALLRSEEAETLHDMLEELPMVEVENLLTPVRSPDFASKLFSGLCV